MSDVRVLMNGLVFGEQPRWHDDRLWFSDWGTQEVIAVDLDGNSEVVLRGRSFPLCVDWLPDGRLLVVSAREGLLLRQERDGSLQTHGDLGSASDPPAGNELVVDARRQRVRQRRRLRPDGRRGRTPRGSSRSSPLTARLARSPTAWPSRTACSSCPTIGR